MRALGLLALCLLLAGLPSTAHAGTLCVGVSGGDCDATYSTIGDDSAAGSAVAVASNGDTIRIGPGSYPEKVSTSKELHFVGAGSGTLDSFDPATQTRIAAPIEASGQTAMKLFGGGSVASMQLTGGIGTIFSGGGGLLLAAQAAGDPLDYSLTNVVARGAPGFPGGSGLIISSGGTGRIIDSTVSGGAFSGSSGATNGVTIDVPGGTSTLTGIVFRSGPANGRGVGVSGGSVRLIRSRGVGEYVGLSVTASTGDATVEATDSVFTTTGQVGDDFGASVFTPAAYNASLSARGSSFLAHGDGAASGVGVLKASGASGSASADLRNTVARSDSSDPGAADLRSDRGTVSADFSSFTTRQVANGGTAPVPGSASNVAGDPLFTNPAGDDLTLQPGSPLIDRGDPSIVLPGQLDLAGSPRSLDGNGDCVARPDIGAFERPDLCPPPPPPANVAPNISGFTATNKVFAPKGKVSSAARRRPKRGTIFRYTLSEAARVTIAIERILPGRRVRSRGRTRCVTPTRKNRRAKRCRRYRRAGALAGQEQAGRRATPFSGRFRRRGLGPGRYRARIVAVDAQGARSLERQLNFRVVRP